MTATQKPNGGQMALKALDFLTPFIKFSAEHAKNNTAITDVVSEFGVKLDDVFEAKSTNEVKEIGAGLLAVSELAALMSTMVGLRFIAREALGVNRLTDTQAPIDPRLS